MTRHLSPTPRAAKVNLDVEAGRLQPLPPAPPAGWTPAVGERVEVFESDLWWDADVLRKVSPPTCLAHPPGTPAWHTRLAHLPGKPAWHTCLAHLPGTPVSHTCLAHLLA